MIIDHWPSSDNYRIVLTSNVYIMKYIFTSIVMMLSVSVCGKESNSLPTDSLDAPDTLKTQNLSDVTITSRRSGTRRLAGAVNGIVVNREELFKAACCNLGESFTTNPSVDVNYSDAATGAKQIKLLGLSGTYVQMLTGMPSSSTRNEA